ncbi:MAG: hypothetical protein Q4C69_12465 [Lachnoclostridium edouardi]|uniref:hypothetical protein n=1 Tax=Lachnoclostridium edouardi TaxID=1926283 RepID=UPI0026DA9D4E|nr:hypothetical protein [Lachnoclostridium edouardi]MDO4279633.1 hypothetical protein [Lachnoclostridium edouardi]
MFAVASPSDPEEVYLEDIEDVDIYDEEYEGSIDLSTASNASLPPSIRSSYNGVYDGSISSAALQLFRDVVEKLPAGTHYVMFREDRYNYRLVYSDSLEFENGRFTADSASYVRYYTYDSATWSYGEEGRFSLTPGSYVVYSDLGEMYPVLIEGVRHYEFETLLFLFALYLLFNVISKFFSVGGYRI